MQGRLVRAAAAVRGGACWPPVTRYPILPACGCCRPPPSWPGPVPPLAVLRRRVPRLSARCRRAWLHGRGVSTERWPCIGAPLAIGRRARRAGCWRCPAAAARRVGPAGQRDQRVRPGPAAGGAGTLRAAAVAFGFVCACWAGSSDCRRRSRRPPCSTVASVLNAFGVPIEVLRSAAGLVIAIAIILAAGPVRAGDGSRPGRGPPPGAAGARA